MTELLRNRLMEARAFAITFIAKVDIETGSGGNNDDAAYRKEAALQLERALMRLEETE